MSNHLLGGYARSCPVSESRWLKIAGGESRAWAGSIRARGSGSKLVRTGSNLNQVTRWANTHKMATEAVQVVSYLVVIERELAALADNSDRDGD